MWASKSIKPLRELQIWEFSISVRLFLQESHQTLIVKMEENPVISFLVVLLWEREQQHRPIFAAE